MLEIFWEFSNKTFHLILINQQQVTASNLLVWLNRHYKTWTTSLTFLNWVFFHQRLIGVASSVQQFRSVSCGGTKSPSLRWEKAISRICPGSHCVCAAWPKWVSCCRKKSSLISSRGVKNRPTPSKNTINCLEEFYFPCTHTLSLLLAQPLSLHYHLMM
jgi:hypothetical protein